MFLVTLVIIHSFALVVALVPQSHVFFPRCAALGPLLLLDHLGSVLTKIIMRIGFISLRFHHLFGHARLRDRGIEGQDLLFGGIGGQEKLNVFIKIFQVFFYLVGSCYCGLSLDKVLPLLLILGDQLGSFMEMLVLIFSQLGDI